MEQGDSFRRFVAEMSTRFSGIAAERVDAEIDLALEQLVALLGTDRSSLLELLPEDGAMVISHSWAHPGVAAAQTATRVTGAFPWYHAQLRRGETLRFDRLPEDLPAHAREERAYAAELPMLSHVAVPLMMAGRWVCALVTATARNHRSWTDDDVERIRIVGQILANAIHRRNIETKLSESLAVVRRLQRRLEAENRYLRESIEGNAGFEEIAGRSEAIREALELAVQVAPTSTAVLLLGETGTGKELLARAIHARSRRAERPLIKVNCAALPSSLVESELFGHEKGAFTGAIAAKAGRFELADGGTLFLDEVADLSPVTQPKILRVLQEGEFERVGGTKTIRVDVRIVTASNQGLANLVREKRFREDLFYRLQVIPIRTPPLRERPEDLPLLASHFLENFVQQVGKRITGISEEALELLQRHSWPGNVRELENVLERAVALETTEVIQPERLPEALRAPARFEPLPPIGDGFSIDAYLRSVEARLLEEALEQARGDRAQAARLLGITPRSLRYLLQKHTVTPKG